MENLKGVHESMHIKYDSKFKNMDMENGESVCAKKICRVDKAF